jgi:hypothetical protein
VNAVAALDVGVGVGVGLAWPPPPGEEPPPPPQADNINDATIDAASQFRAKTFIRNPYFLF